MPTYWKATATERTTRAYRVSPSRYRTHLRLQGPGREPSGRILGAHLIGPHADEVINVFALAIRHGLTPEDLKRTMFAYPTGASDIGYML